MLALLAQLFAFHAGWAPPLPPPPPVHISRHQAVASALWYCRERGFACRPDGVRFLRDGVWRVRLDAARRHKRRRLVVDLDAWSGAVLAARSTYPGYWPRRGW